MPKAAIFVPHGRVPDRRGFAPAIVAEQLGRRYGHFSPLFISAAEAAAAPSAAGDNFEYIDVSKTYVRLFQKLTRLDPWPLHARLAAMLRRTRPDLLHVHQLEFPVAEFMQRYGRKIPVVLHAHVTTQRPRRIGADAYLAVSDFVKNRLIEKGFPEDAIHVVRNGVDSNVFSPVSQSARSFLRKKLNIPESARVLIFFGRKQEVKGYDFFLGVAERLTAALPELRVFAIGPEPDDSSREPSYCQRMSLRERLLQSRRFFDLAPLPHEQLADYLRCADAALLPSRSEPQGMAMLEAMACGCPTVSTKVGGIPESITHGVSGILLEAPSGTTTGIEQATQELAHLLRASDKAVEMGTTAAETVRKNFDWAKSAARTEEIYSELLLKNSQSGLLE
ncbi:glycosyltransferase family 4 protein [Rhodocyclus gracilis]|uniref:Glycosyltransferase n=1 Tax=Rhodocyclus tenuis TaxID=1066 RepID=A0A6L5K0Z0_RHOTE|nr:glycosyltransferase family 4 protein [Rhodocyclus gracilis]MQY52564.1 glycosyltransferase [Rhodocyclus gracilis]